MNPVVAALPAGDAVVIAVDAQMIVVVVLSRSRTSCFVQAGDSFAGGRAERLHNCVHVTCPEVGGELC